MEKGAFGSVGAVEEFAEVGRNAASEVVFVGLAEEEASSWWGLEEFGCEQAAEAVRREEERLARLVVLLEFVKGSLGLLDNCGLSGRGMIGYEGGHGQI